MNWLAFIMFMTILPAGVILLGVLNRAADRYGEARVMVVATIVVWLIIACGLGVGLA